MGWSYIFGGQDQSHAYRACTRQTQTGARTVHFGRYAVDPCGFLEDGLRPEDLHGKDFQSAEESADYMMRFLTNNLTWNKYGALVALPDYF